MDKQEQLRIYLAIVKCIIESHKTMSAKLMVMASLASNKEREEAALAAEQEYAQAMDKCLALLEEAAS